MKFLSKSRLAAAAVAVVGLAASIAAPSIANAQEAGGMEMVTFGDSFTANGGARGERAAASPFLPPLNPCRNDKRNWAHQTAAKLNLSLADYSCNGTSYDLALYVADALNSGRIGPNTKEVVLMYGGLQPGTYLDMLGNLALADIPKTSTYRGFLDAQFKAIRTRAPHARITMLNYLPMTVNDTLCLVHHNNVIVPVSFPQATRLEDEFNYEIGRAAAALGVNHINVHDQARTHDTCQPDPNARWVVAVPSSTAPSVMPFHPTDVGHDGMANIIANGLRQR